MKESETSLINFLKNRDENLKSDSKIIKGKMRISIKPQREKMTKIVIDLEDKDLAVANLLLKRQKENENDLKSNNINDLVVEIFRKTCDEFYEMVE